MPPQRFLLRMSSVLHLTRLLSQEPELVSVEGVRLRHFGDPQDAEIWLELRHKAFARQKVGVRRWDASDFAAEFLSRPWWRPEHLWFAHAEVGWSRRPLDVGTVTLALRGTGPSAKPVVHWLAVLPEWRRRGIGRLLMSALERTAWHEGHRQIWLETHVAWDSAVALYEQLGYRPEQ